MRLKKRFIQLRDGYVRRQAESVIIPSFPAEEPVRLRVTFSGRVQHVGFRYEVCLLAERLRLTGWCQNLEDGSVLAEFQGPESCIRFLLTFMSSLKRIRIREMREEPLPLSSSETGFSQKA